MTTKTNIEKQEIEQKFSELLNICTRCRTPENKELVRKAFDLACVAHKGMRRRSGEPYIIHPIEVAKIVASEIGLGTTSVVCSLLHDVVEDTEYTLEDIKGMFGEKIASIIDGLTKISGVFDQGSLQAENFRKMLLTLSDDVRVILIKLADRLHNMRTLDSLPSNKQIKISGETLFIYAPLAHRLGLYAIKTELEDLSLKYEHPRIYNELWQKVEESEKKRTHYINKFSFPIMKKLDEKGIDFKITGRPKSIYSIWNKMQAKNIPFEEVYDVFAIRLIFNHDQKVQDKNQCWNIYSIITDIYKPKPDRLRDWISTPKANGYEALHTTVMGPEGRWVEIQIRSDRMDEIAERGFAAHWKYKGETGEARQLDNWIRKVREMLENPEADALEFIDDFKMNLFSSEIFIFTPKGLLIRMPKGVTALDFAYEIHSEIGNQSIGAKVNHKLVPLSHVLHSGDQVEILTSDKQSPQREWLDFIITAKAKTSIKNALKKEKKDSINRGKEILDDKLKALGLHVSSDIFRKLLTTYKISSKDELYSNIGLGIIDLANLQKIVTKKPKNKLIRYWRLQFSKTTYRMNKNIRRRESKTGSKPQVINKKKPLLLTENIEGLNFTIAKCCNPIPGDDVMGFIADDDSVIIHKRSCEDAIRLMSSFGDKILSATWETHKLLSFLAKIKLKGIDRMGIFNDISTLISKELDVNIQSILLDTHDGVFEGAIGLYIHNTNDLDNLIHDLKKIKGVRSVVRDESKDD